MMGSERTERGSPSRLLGWNDRAGPLALNQEDFLEASVRPLEIARLINLDDHRIIFTSQAPIPVPAWLRGPVLGPFMNRHLTFLRCRTGTLLYTTLNTIRKPARNPVCREPVRLFKKDLYAGFTD